MATIRKSVINTSKPPSIRQTTLLTEKSPKSDITAKKPPLPTMSTTTKILSKTTVAAKPTPMKTATTKPAIVAKSTPKLDIKTTVKPPIVKRIADSTSSPTNDLKSPKKPTSTPVTKTLATAVTKPTSKLVIKPKTVTLTTKPAVKLTKAVVEPPTKTKLVASPSATTTRLTNAPNAPRLPAAKPTVASRTTTAGSKPATSLRATFSPAAKKPVVASLPKSTTLGQAKPSSKAIAKPTSAIRTPLAAKKQVTKICADVQICVADSTSPSICGRDEDSATTTTEPPTLPATSIPDERGASNFNEIQAYKVAEQIIEVMNTMAAATTGATAEDALLRGDSVVIDMSALEEAVDQDATVMSSVKVLQTSEMNDELIAATAGQQTADVDENEVREEVGEDDFKEVDLIRFDDDVRNDQVNHQENVETGEEVGSQIDDDEHECANVTDEVFQESTEDAAAATTDEVIDTNGQADERNDIDESTESENLSAEVEATTTLMDEEVSAENSRLSEECREETAAVGDASEKESYVEDNEPMVNDVEHGLGNETTEDRNDVCIESVGEEVENISENSNQSDHVDSDETPLSTEQPEIDESNRVIDEPTTQCDSQPDQHHQTDSDQLADDQAPQLPIIDITEHDQHENQTSDIAAGIHIRENHFADDSTSRQPADQRCDVVDDFEVVESVPADQQSPANLENVVAGVEDSRQTPVSVPEPRADTEIVVDPEEAEARVESGDQGEQPIDETGVAGLGETVVQPTVEVVDETTGRAEALVDEQPPQEQRPPVQPIYVDRADDDEETSPESGDRRHEQLAGDDFERVQRRRNKRQNKRSRKSFRAFKQQEQDEQQPLDDIREHAPCDDEDKAFAKRRNSRRSRHSMKKQFRRYSEPYAESHCYSAPQWKTFYHEQ